MAEKRINKDDLFEPGLLVDIINQFKELEKISRANLASFKETLKNNPFKNVQDVKDFNAAIAGVQSESKMFAETQKATAKATKELDEALAKEVATSKEIKDLLDDVNGSLDQNILLQSKRSNQIKELNKEQKKLSQEFEKGRISASKFNTETAKLSKQTQELKQANSDLGFTIRAQIKEGQAASTSFEQQAQRLGQLRKAYRKLNEEQRNNANVGGILLDSITKLDKQVKENDASIGNFQRNVGNYTSSVSKAVKETGLFDKVLGLAGTSQAQLNILQAGFGNAVGKSTGKLKLLKIAIASTGIGLLVVALGSIITSLTSSEEGFQKLSKGLKAVGIVFGNVSDVFAAVGDQILNVFSGIGKAAVQFAKGDFSDAWETAQKTMDNVSTDKIEEAIDNLINKTGEEIAQQNELSDIRTENLKLQRQLTVETAKGEKEIAELRLKARDKEKFDQEQRQAFLERAARIEIELLNKELDLAERKNKIAQGELEFNRSGTEELNNAAEAEAELFKVQTKRLNRSRELQSELNTAKKEGQKTDAREREKDLEPIRRNEFLEQQKANKKAEEENQKTLDTFVAQKKKQLKEEEKLKKEADDKEEERQKNNAERNEEIQQSVLQSLDEAFTKLGEKRQKDLEEEQEKTDKQVERQERRAEQGLSNTLALEEKKAAELEVKREEEAEKAERRAKVLAFFNAVASFNEDEPLTAIGKATAQAAIAEGVAGLFYEGTDRVADDIVGAPMLPGRDGYVIGVNGEERIFGHDDSLKIRSMFGSITNTDLIDLAKAGATSSTQYFNDSRIVSGLAYIAQSYKDNAQQIDIDKLGQLVETKVNNGLKKVTTYKSRGKKL